MSFKLRYIFKAGALLLCILFFTLPLVQCTVSSDINATGLEIAVGSGVLMENVSNEEGANPFVFALLLIPLVMLVLSFLKKSFAVLRNISIAGLIAKIVFMISSTIKFNSSDYESMVKLTVYNWFVVFIYVGLIILAAYCHKTGRE